MLGMIYGWFLIFAFPMLMAFGAASDLVAMRLSNRVALLLIVGFGLAAFFVDIDMNHLIDHLIYGGSTLLVCFAIFAVGWFAGGDAKFATGIMLWIGPESALLWIIYTSLLGGAMALVLLKLRKHPLPAFLRYEWLLNLCVPGSGVPYGIAMATAALILFPSTHWMKSGFAFLV